ncbi:carbohydrate porin [Stenotrophomonas indicatrix]|uniref:carbohydrate porin n=1 Tax=Stenotrophomonas indicatrix TaxID=2045451 RepID=UPI001F0C5F9F|nr:carbohydrate porin [Stenotrophomonas indicatrix]MCR8713419.1 carbohydrate porin [Stenotrophomonas indicatrix]
MGDDPHRAATWRQGGQGVVRIGHLHVDVLSLVWNRLDISSRIAWRQQLAGKDVQSNAQFVELDYGVPVAPWLVLRPAVQYVACPGAYASRPDSWVFTLQAQSTL